MEREVRSGEMSNVPKIVLKRLQSPAPASHPDADCLTAFVERLLPQPERVVVLDHLALCGECREVVAFALPPTEAVRRTSTSSPIRGWLTLPVLRWGVAAAGILAVTSVGILQFRQHQQDQAKGQGKDDKEKPAVSALVSRNQMSGYEMQRSAPSSQTPALPADRPIAGQIGRGKSAELREQTEVAAATSPGALGRNEVVEATPVVPPPAPRPHASAGMFRTPPGHGFAAGGSGGGIGSGTPASSSARPAAIPSSSEMVKVEVQAAPATTTVEVQGTASVMNTETAQTSARLSQNQMQLPLPSRSVASSDVVKAKDPVPPPLWSISANGALQRSLDAGLSWETVSVDADSRANVTVMNAAKEQGRKDHYQDQGSNADRLEMDQPEQKEPRQKMKKSPSNATPVFRALAANGLEVWAGGSAATLYHSVDGGAHWTRVLPSSAGSVLTGDITALEFSDQQHGRITTSTPALWITADDGQTWQKLP